MARYVFTICVDGACAYYEESTAEQDRADAGLTAFGGSGYLSFWQQCKEVLTEFERLSEAVRGMKHLGDLIPNVQYLANGGDVKAVILDLNYDECKEL